MGIHQIVVTFIKATHTIYIYFNDIPVKIQGQYPSYNASFGLDWSTTEKYNFNSQFRDRILAGEFDLHRFSSL